MMYLRLLIVCVLSLFVSPGLAQVVYVDQSATGANAGTSWQDAYVDLQDALSQAAGAGGEIWVAAATYLPTTTTNRAISFELAPNVELFGGFNGTETARHERDWSQHVTILSGDIGVPGDHTDNSYNVVRYSGSLGSGVGIVVDGFTITGGNANSASHNRGGGMHLVGTDVLVTNCIFKKNRAASYGGAIAVWHASPTVTNTLFFENVAYGGAVLHVDSGGHPVLINTTLTENAGAFASAIYSISNLTIRNGVIWDNGSGPAIVENGNATVTHSIVQGGFTGTGNLNVAPDFVGSGDFRLLAGSPAIDAGDNQWLPLDVYDLDGDGNTTETVPYDLIRQARIDNGVVDMGAYEGGVVLAACAQPPPGMIGWWPLDETSGSVVEDLTGYMSQPFNNGTTMQGPLGTAGSPAPAPGMVDGSFRFGSIDDYVAISHDNSLDVGAGDFTIDMWFNRASGFSDLMPLFSKIDQGAGYALSLQFAGGSDFYYRLDLNDGNTSDMLLGPSHPSPATTWIHLTAVVDRQNAEARFYLDGALHATLPITITGSVDNTDRAYIAYDPKFTSVYFPGRIDEVELFDRALSPAEILSIVQAGPDGKCKPSVSLNATPSAPRSTESLSAYPNPTTGATTLTFSLTTSARTTLQLFDVTGRLVRNLGESVRHAGEHRVVVDADGLPAGMYIVRLNAGSQVASLPLVIYR